MKRPLQSKTVWFSIALMVMGVLQGFIMEIPIDPREQSLILIVVGLVSMYLRFKTKHPLI